MQSFFLFLTMLVISSIANCQIINGDTTKLYPMKEVVITATRYEKNSFDVGKGISIITQEQINNTYTNQLSDVISSTEGLSIIGVNQNYGMNQSVFLRGANSNQTAIMIDDIRISDPSSVNNSLNITELTLSNIERVEIVRGLNSTLYGSSAIGGVINMISKKSANPGINVDLNLNAGVFGKSTVLFNQDLFVNYTSRLGYYTNFSVNNSDVKGIDATIDTVTSLEKFNQRDKDGYHERDISGKIGYTNENTDIYASFKNTHQNIDLDKRAYVDDDNYKMVFERNLLIYGLTYRLKKNVNVKFVGGYSNMLRSAVDDSSIVDEIGTFDHTYVDEKYRGKTFTNEFQIHGEYPGIEFLLGTDIYKEWMTSKLYYYSSVYGIYEYTTDLDTLNLNATTGSIFGRVNVNGKILYDELESYSVAFGTRWVNHSSFGSKLLFEVNPQVKLTPSSMLYASFATGFNSPSLYQLYSPNKDSVSGITRGNSYLKPELSHSIEVGFKNSVKNNFDLNVSYFYTKTRDMIEYVYLWDKNIGLDTLGNDWMRNDYRGDTYLNLGDQIVNGIEIGFRSLINDKFTIEGNICLVDGKIKYKPTNIDTSITHGNHVQVYNNGAFMTKESEYLGLVRRPSTANLSFIYSPFEDFSFRTDLKYIGKKGDVYYDSKLGPFGALGTTPLSDYTLVDISSKYQFNKNVSINMEVENVFNTKYVEIKGFSTRGRGIYLSMRYLLNY